MTTKKIDIYEKYIIPTIQNSNPGDKLLFISPSTFFGYYSLGANNFEKVCEVLEESVKRKVDLRLIINIHDPFSARAALGLLKFLNDGQNIRNWNNTDIYRITCISGDFSRATNYEFSSREKKSVKYLAGALAIPYFEIKSGGGNIDDKDKVEGLKREFDSFWKISKKIGNDAYKYDIDQIRMKNIRLWKGVSYLMTFIIGMITSYVIIRSKSGSSGLTVEQILLSAVASITFGVLSTLISNYFLKTWRV